MEMQVPYLPINCKAVDLWSSGFYNLLVLIALDSTGIMDTEIKVLVLQGGFMTP